MSNRRTPLSLAAVVGAVALVVAACANSPEVGVSGVEPPPVEPTVTATPTGEPAPTPTTEPTAEPEPTTLPAPAGFGCDTEPLPDDVTEVTEAEVDIDGDDEPDSAVAYHAGADPATGWAVRVTFGNGDIVEAPVDFGFPELIGVQSVGGADMNGDGRDEVFATVGTGAAATLYGIFVIDPEACTIEPIEQEGAPLEVAAGASVGAIGGLRCDDADGNGVNDTVVLYTGALVFDTDPPQYDVNEQRFELEGSRLRFLDSQNYVAAFGSPDFPGGRIDCPPLLL